MTRSYLFFLLLLCTTSLVASEVQDEDCEDTSDACNEMTEYNAYLDCLQQQKRAKREIGCPLVAAQSCEYIDCTECSGCQQDDSCSASCRKCCTESCNDQLCCHKTCNNQCKTNYCRSSCRKECKDKIVTGGGEFVVNSDSQAGGQQTANINTNSDTRTNSRHNITTIINLHNIINNTNQIDIPIKINNTNFNNITLAVEDQSTVDVNQQGNGGYRERVVDRNGNRCCQVIGPRICNKLHVFPFLSCFHYRKQRCGPFCNAPIMHAQPQQICEENNCHNRMIYIPQPQPSCFHVPYWPFVNCGGGGGGGGEMANCHGCYKHYTHKRHIPHGGCSRCYDDGFSEGPYLRQGPYYRPGYAHMPSCLQLGTCGFGGMGMGYGGFGMGGFGMGGYGMGGYGMGMGMGGFGGYQGALGGYPVNNLGYPLDSYFSEYDDGRNITVTNDEDEMLNSLSQGFSPSVEFNTEPGSRNSRYASIVIDGQTHDEKSAAKEEKPVKVESKVIQKRDKEHKSETKVPKKTTTATTVKV